MVLSRYLITYSHFELFVPLCSLTTIEGEDRTEVKNILACRLLYQVGGSTVARLARYFGQAGQAGLTLPAKQLDNGLPAGLSQRNLELQVVAKHRGRDRNSFWGGATSAAGHLLELE